MIRKLSMLLLLLCGIGNAQLLVSGGSTAPIKIEYVDSSILSNATGTMKTTTLQATEITNVGQIFHIHTHGQVTDNGGASGVNTSLNFRLDAVTVCTSATNSGTSNSTAILDLDVYLMITALGSSGGYVISCNGVTGALVSAGLNSVGFSLAPVTIDWTVSHTWNFTETSTSLANAKQGLTEIIRYN